MNKYSKILTVVAKLNTSKVFFCTVGVVFFLLILVLNIYYPICLDDWTYSFVFGEQPSRRIQSISDIFLSQYNHYKQWGGRSVVHFIAQFLLFCGTPINDIINSCAYILFVYLVYCFCKIKNSLNVSLFVLINISVWFLQPDFFSTVIWLTGASNYLWGTSIILLFMYPYFIFYTTKKSKGSIGKSSLFFLAGILAGWTNENTALGMLFILISFLVYLKYKEVKIPLWAIFGLIGAITGYLIMILAPGNFERASHALAVSGQGQKSLFRLLPYRLYMIFVNFWGIISLMYGLYAISLYAYMKHNKIKLSHDTLFVSLFFFIGANVAIWVMLLSPEFPHRAWFGIITFIIIAIGILLVNTKLSYPRGQIMCHLLLLCGCILFMIDYGIKCQGTYQLGYLMKKRIDFIVDEKKRGVKDIVINEQIVIPTIYPEYRDVTQYPPAWQNHAYLSYFDLNSIVYKPVK